MGQLLNDMIHMTEGEKLVAYWWLWTGITLIGLAVMLWERNPWRRR